MPIQTLKHIRPEQYISRITLLSCWSACTIDYTGACFLLILIDWLLLKSHNHYRLWWSLRNSKTSLRIPKGAIRIRVYRRRTDNTMAKKCQRTNNDLQNIQIKLKIE
jgi:hypothetical protein